MKYIYNKINVNNTDIYEKIVTTYDVVDDENIKALYPNSIILRENINSDYLNMNKQPLTNTELYNIGKYKLKDNEIIENGVIREVNLAEYEYIEDNVIKYRLEEHKRYLLQHLEALKTQEMEEDIAFKGAYQRNRELDRNNIVAVLFGMQATKQAVFNDWKMKDTNGDDVYITLTIQELMQLGLTMQANVTKIMKKESKIRIIIKNLSVEEIKVFNLEVEYRK